MGSLYRCRCVGGPTGVEEYSSTKVHHEGALPDNLAVDGAADTVLQLQVHLGNGVFGEDGGVRDITCALLASALIS